ncbi:MAG: isoleucine--tRNA ligase [Holosporaceae bacterium]|jgi:isoleucyl-tRNA synthetase|nr:isoleucine--tRNA ligase [Holosporaceae bacterium]
MNFKDTIFLPKTDFQMRGNLATKEPEILKYWDEIDIYEKTRTISKGRKKFVLHDGPPFANGAPHAGTAMNKVLKDIIVRMKQMQGFDAPFVPGWDCHGLPIEWKVEEQLRDKNRKKDDIPVVEFRDMCKEFAEYWIDVQRDGFRRLGINADWKNPYLTMNREAEVAVIKQIGKFIVDDTLYRGKKPVFWSVVEQTALADAEIEYIDKESNSIYVAFEIKSSFTHFLEGAYCAIWTTTPWTIPANRAISFSQDRMYCLLEVLGKKIIMAKDLVETFSCVTKLSIKIIQLFVGELLEGVICRHPFYKSGYEFNVPLIHGDHVDIKAGTGFVHTAPGHGTDDFYICKKVGIDVPRTVDEAGFYYDDVPMFAGKHIFDVEDEIINALADVGSLLFKSSITHSYPHAWRSKAPAIYRTTPQWFISLDNTKLRQKALAEIDKTTWIPKQGYNRIKAFIENREDWCISRQRAWGVPLPLFVNKKTDEPLQDPEVIDRIIDIIATEGTNSWFSKNPQLFLGDKYDAENYEQVLDTVDVWFESASTHAYVVKNTDPNAQADLYVEGSDQHRGWFQHSLLNSCGTFGNSPFKAIMTHGFIVDEQGNKMSKSLGNVVTLDDVVKNLGADIFRIWVALSDFTQDLKLGMNILKQFEDVYRKLRNTLRYMLGALSGYDSSVEFVEYNELPDLEKCALHRLWKINAELMSSIELYDINKYFTTLHTFCSGDLSSFFFDIRKDCLYCDHKNDQKRKAYRCVLNIVFQHIVRWLAPIIVYTSEEAWLNFNDASSVHLEKFLIPDEKWNNPVLCKKIEEVKVIRKSITTALEIARKDKIIGSSLQACVKIFDPEQIIPIKDERFWKEVSITSDVVIKNNRIPGNAFVSEDLKEIGIVVSVANGKKCERCWEVVTSLNEDNICKRCQIVLAQKD